MSMHGRIMLSEEEFLSLPDASRKRELLDGELMICRLQSITTV